jgi:hypothetical protein
MPWRVILLALAVACFVLTALVVPHPALVPLGLAFLAGGLLASR